MGVFFCTNKSKQFLVMTQGPLVTFKGIIIKSTWKTIDILYSVYWTTTKITGLKNELSKCNFRLRGVKDTMESKLRI